MHQVTLRERQRLPHKPCQPLPQRIIEPLDMARLARSFAACPMQNFRNDLLIGRPKIGKHQPLLVSLRDTRP